MSIHYNPDAAQQRTCLRLITPSRTPRPGARSMLGAFTTSCPETEYLNPNTGKEEKKKYENS